MPIVRLPFVVVVHAAGCDKYNLDSQMCRSRCAADCRSLCSQVQHVIDRSIAKPAVADDRDLCLPHLHSTPPLGGSRRTTAMAFDTDKL